MLSNLPTGPYRLEVSLAGFRTYAQTGIVLQVAGTPTINAETAEAAEKNAQGILSVLCELCAQTSYFF